MADPRVEVIGRRLAGVKNIVAVCGGKGGVGKSIIATVLALTLSRRGLKVGLLDLDFTSPSTHVILGVKGLFPEEEKGIIPPLTHGLRYISIVFYALDKPAPLRGSAVSEAIIELMAITRWGELDYLVIDMPPGIGDATLDLIKLVAGINFLVVTTPSIVAFETVRKLILLLQELKASVLGVTENMVQRTSKPLREKVEILGVPYLGAVSFDPEVEDFLGQVGALMETQFAKDVELVSFQLEIRLEKRKDLFL